MAETKKQVIYDEIKRRIAEGEYSENEMLTERSLAAEFAVSKTPVRESLSILCQEGYLDRYPNCGYIVKGLSYAEALALAEMRIIVESAAVKIAIKYATDDELAELRQFLDNDEDSTSIGLGRNTSFHCGISQLTHNPFIENTVRNLVMQANKSSQGILRNQDIGVEHEKILKAMEERNVDKAIEYLIEDISLKDQREI